MVLTNALRKFIKSLDDLKGRRRERLFKAEGSKCVADTFSAFSLFALFATQNWCDQHPQIAGNAADALIVVNRAELQRLSSMSTTPDVIAVYHIPDSEITQINPSGLTLALDGIQDPGNLGTIMRLADWFGISSIIASRETADCFAPKVVQATMGAITRVRVSYVDLPQTIEEIARKGVPVYGTFLDGENIYSSTLSSNGVIVVGNEGHGISPQVAATVSRRLTIPSFPPQSQTSESLNAAIATAIVVSRFREPQLSVV